MSPLFGLEGLAYFRIQLKRDTDGVAAIWEGHYDNGMMDSHLREK